MDYLSDLYKKQAKPTTDTDHHPEKHQQQNHPHHQASNSELLASAKLVADAAQSSLRHENFDKQKAAGAAADLLGAASHYGNLEEKSFGKYVEQAETYLHKYGHSSHSSTTTTTTSGHPGTTTTTTHSESHSESHSGGYDGEGDGKSGSGGYGGYLKMAEGFMKKH
ncbi:nodulin-related protein 1 [Fagus crenata]